MAACISRLISTVISTRITTIYRVYRKYDINTNDIVRVVKIRITTLQRVARCLVFCVVFCRSLSFWPFSFDHWVVCPSPIYGFWLSLWYHETFLKYNGSFLQLLKKWQSDCLTLPRWQIFEHTMYVIFVYTANTSCWKIKYVIISAMKTC
jgi:hypothetical protein